MAGSDRAAALRAALGAGVVIPAHPLALTADRTLDERHQRALTRYYVRCRRRRHRRRRAHDAVRHSRSRARPLSPGARAGGRVGARVARRAHAPVRARRRRDRRHRAGRRRSGARRVARLRSSCCSGSARCATRATPSSSQHCRAVADVLPVFGFYLQPAVGGRVLSYDFWRAFAEIERVWAIKIAPFNRYQTLDVVRAVADAGRDDIALYTGNDDNIVADLLTPIPVGARRRHRAESSAGCSASGPSGRTPRCGCSISARRARDDGAVDAVAAPRGRRAHRRERRDLRRRARIRRLHPGHPRGAAPTGAARAAPGASIRTRRSRPVRPRRSIGCAASIRRSTTIEFVRERIDAWLG